MRIKMVFSSIFLILALLNTPIVAAEGPSLSIYPPVIQIQATPPSSPNAPIIIKNQSENDISLKIELIPFATKGLDGDIELKPELLDNRLYAHYKNKIQILVDGYKSNIISLKPLESKEINVNINLPEGDTPGDYYFSIIFMADEASQKNTSISNIPTGIATNLLLSIGPKDETSGDISQFKTNFFQIAGPVEFKLKIHNSSKHHILPTGFITVKNIFGKTQGKINILPQFILARSDRYLSDSHLNPDYPSASVIWEEKNLFGIYKAEANISLDERGKVLTSTLYFIGFPLYLFLSIVIFIFIFLSLYLKAKKKI